MPTFDEMLRVLAASVASSNESTAAPSATPNNYSALLGLLRVAKNSTIKTSRNMYGKWCDAMDEFHAQQQQLHGDANSTKALDAEQFTEADVQVLRNWDSHVNIARSIYSAPALVAAM